MMVLKAVSMLALGVAAIGGKTPTVAKNPNVPPVVTLTARDYTFDSIPDIPAGVIDLRLHNLGPDFHHAAIFKLFGGHTAEQFVAASKNPGPPPAWAMPVPGPNAPPIGGTSNVIAEYTPGNYVVLCFIDTNGGVPHFMKGMSRGFKVVASKNHAKGPKADIALTLADYAFKFAPALTAGEHTVRMTNIAKQPHEIEIFKLDDGKTEKDLHEWIMGAMKTKPPANAVGGVVGIMPGAHPEFRVTLTPGHYVAYCFAMQMHPHDPNTVYIVPLESDQFRCTPEAKLRVYRTKNGGESWEALTNGLPQSGAYETVLRDALGADSSKAGGIYFGTRSGKVFGSQDGGDSWQEIADGFPSVVCVKTATVPAATA